MKPKTNQKTKPTAEAGGYDDCGTPAYALLPIAKALGYWQTMHWADPIVWEPALGEGLLKNALELSGFKVKATTFNFFEAGNEPHGCTHLVTNPPYSNKYAWIKHALDMQLPTALLLPVEAMATQAFWTACDGNHPIAVALMIPRVNFKMPNKGWDGSGAQFPTAWFVWNWNNGWGRGLYPIVQTKKEREQCMREAKQI